MKKTLYFHCPQMTGCHTNRLLNPARFCKDKYPDWNFLAAQMLLPEDHPDIIMTYGMPNWAEYNLVSTIKENGGKHIWAIDDDYLTLPPWNPSPEFSHDRADLYKIYARTADYVTVSTKHLLGQVKHYGLDKRSGYDNSQNYYVLPNLVDPKEYRLTDQRIPKGKPVQILWAGSPTHRRDLEALVEPITKIHERYPRGTVDFLWFGDCHPELRRLFFGKNLYEWPGCDTQMYHRNMAQSFAAHIGLAPLFDCVFNRSRSNLKFLEYAAMGAVPLVSDCESYHDAWPDAKDHLCNTTTDWYDAMTSLIENEGLRVKLGTEVRQLVDDKYSWQNAKCREPWYNFFDLVLK